MNSDKYNADVETYVDFLNGLNTTGSNKKRTRSNSNQVSYSYVFYDLQMSAISRLINLESNILNNKGNQLLSSLSNLKIFFSQFITALKSDVNIGQKMPDTIKLGVIAELSVCCLIIELLYDKAQTKRTNQTLKTYLLNYTYKMESEKPEDDDLKTNDDYNKTKQLIKKTKIDMDAFSNKSSSTQHIVFDSDTNDDEDTNEDTYEEEEVDDDVDDEDDVDEVDINEDQNAWGGSIFKTPEQIDCESIIFKIFRSRDSNYEAENIKQLLLLSEPERKSTIEKLDSINNYNLIKTEKTQLFYIMNLPLSIEQKHKILKWHKTIVTEPMSTHDGEKLQTMFDALMTIPFGQYKGIDIASVKPKVVKTFLNNLETDMNKAVYGHEDAKRYIVQMIGQLIKNPDAKGNMLGIWGPPGNGKTSLIKEGIAKSLGKPFVFISLGGATDGSFLEGHSYTYVGSICGRIAEALITSKCMNPIIYFDELDKISTTNYGKEITNILIHLTDPIQNSHFRDKYFSGIDLDLSRVTMIFSFNDPSKVDRILLDRITTIETKYLSTTQKVHIGQHYLLPVIMKDMGLKDGDILIDDDIIYQLINLYTHEGGVRKLKSLLYNVVREINLAHLIKSNIGLDKVVYPFKVKTTHIKVLLKTHTENEKEQIHQDNKVGVVNGLWADSLGNGGCLEIQTCWFPSQTPLTLKSTGNLGKIIKESTEVASSLAWKHLPLDIQDKYSLEFKTKPMGIHIHCPDGSGPKEGPSAGAALTLAIYSLFTNRQIRNDVGITGEINLEGNVTAIGGLEQKMEGAKKYGIKTVLFPSKNNKDFEKILESNKTLIDANFKVQSINTFDDVLKYALL